MRQFEEQEARRAARRPGSDRRHVTDEELARGAREARERAARRVSTATIRRYAPYFPALMGGGAADPDAPPAAAKARPAPDPVPATPRPLAERALTALGIAPSSPDPRACSFCGTAGGYTPPKMKTPVRYRGELLGMRRGTRLCARCFNGLTVHPDAVPDRTQEHHGRDVTLGGGGPES